VIRVKWYDQKWSKIAIAYGIISCVAFGAITLLWYYGLSDRNVTTVTVVPDPRLNYATRKSIEEFIQNFCLKSAENGQDKAFFGAQWRTIFQHLKQTFACVKDANAVRKQRTHMYIKFAAHTPAVTLNNNHIVTADGLLIGVQFYRSDIVVTLPHIVADQDIIPSELCQLAQWAVTIPEFVRSQATIIWKNPTEIHLIFKEYPKNSVLITTQTELSPQTIDAIKRVIALDDVAQLDARFDGMLVARVEKKIKTRRRGA